MEKIFIICLFVSVVYCSVKVEDRIIARKSNNLYYPGVVNSIEGESVNVLFDDGDTISHSIRDTSAILPNEEPTGKVQIGQHVLATWKGGDKYYIGFVTGKEVNGRFKVTFDNNQEDYYTASRLRLFPEQDSPFEVGARVFARWRDGLYYRGFVTQASDTSVFIKYDDNSTILVYTVEVRKVILDKIPHYRDVYKRSRVIGFWPGRVRYYPGKVTVIGDCWEEGVYHVKFDDGDQRDEAFYQIRLIPY